MLRTRPHNALTPNTVARQILIVVAATLTFLWSVPARSAEQAWITVLSTTDLHGNILPVDYFTDKPDARGLAKIATIVRQTRRENPSGTLLLDSGDTIQGSPLEYFHNKRNNAPPDPMMLAMGALDYDAMAVGNHEYNYGRAVLDKARRDAPFPWLSANSYSTATGEPFYSPYIVKELNGVRVGVVGLTTPDVPFWDDPANYAGIEFREPVAEAAKWVGVLRGKERVDLVIIAMHMGLDRDLATWQVSPSQLPNENAALAIAERIPGVDLILMGHTHRVVPALVVNGVLLTQANAFGSHVARADVRLERDGSERWRVVAKQSRTIPITDGIDVDQELAQLAEPYDRETREWLNRVIASSPAELTAADAATKDNALLDLVQRVQLDVGHADVSLAASFNAGAKLPRGNVRVRDIAGLYVYDNTLVVIEVTGQQLKDALEHSARYFLPYEAGKTASELIDRRIPAFNFDIAEGVSYDIDITKPVGQRIVNLRFRDAPVAPGQKFRLATNNYRVNGGGGYEMYKDAPEVYRSGTEIRELIIDWIEEHGKIPSEPTHNWRLIDTPQ